MKEAMIDSLKGKKEMPLKQVYNEVNEKLIGKFDGSISWYFTTVKLDLEARNTIERIPSKKSKHIQLNKLKNKRLF